MRTLMRHVRLFAYRRGMRPEQGSLLYSPSLDVVYTFKDAAKQRKYR